MLDKRRIYLPFSTGSVVHHSYHVGRLLYTSQSLECAYISRLSPDHAIYRSEQTTPRAGVCPFPAITNLPSGLEFKPI